MTETPTTRLLTTTQAAERLGVSTEAIRRWVRGGLMEAVVLPSGRLRFREVDIEERLQPTTSTTPKVGAA